MQVTVKSLNQAMHFVAENETGQCVYLDGSPESGGTDHGIGPMENLLASLGGCSGIDVQLILGKQRQVADSLEMLISAERQKNVTPSLFESINVLFKLTGNLDSAKVQKAVDLSMQKFCSVAKILEQATTINYQIELNGNAL